MGREGIGMNLPTFFNIDLYTDALCKIENEMHKDYRYSQLSSCGSYYVLTTLEVHLIVISTIVEVTKHNKYWYISF